MKTNTIELPSFHIECSPGPAISKNLFKILVEQYLKLECHGMYGRSFQDCPPDKTDNWYTESWDYTEPYANEVLHYLTYFTSNFIRDYKLTGTPFDYVNFKIIHTTYIPKEIRRALKTKSESKYNQNKD